MKKRQHQTQPPNTEKINTNSRKTHVEGKMREEQVQQGERANKEWHEISKRQPAEYVFRTDSEQEEDSEDKHSYISKDGEWISRDSKKRQAQRFADRCYMLKVRM